MPRSTQASSSHPLIPIWNKWLGAMPYYTEGELKRARECGAPRNAIYEKIGSNGRSGIWATFDPANNEVNPELAALLTEALESGAGETSIAESTHVVVDGVVVAETRHIDISDKEA